MKKKYDLSVGYRKEIRAYREEYGIPQWLLAEYMGISQSLVSHFEQNRADYLLIDKDIIDARAKKYNRKKKTEVKKELNEPIQLNIGNADLEKLQNSIDFVRKGAFAKIDSINRNIAALESFGKISSKRAEYAIKRVEGFVIDYLEITISRMYIVMVIMFLTIILIQVGMYYG